MVIGGEGVHLVSLVAGGGAASLGDGEITVPGLFPALDELLFTASSRIMDS